VLPQGPGGSTPHPTTAADDHGHHVWTAADLAALLRGERGGPAAAVAIAADGQGTSPAGDVAEFSVPDAALTPGVPADPAASTDRTARAAEATLAQAVAQRLAALASGPRPVTTDLAGRAGAPAQNLVDDLLRKIALTSERTPPAVMTTATRLVNSFATAVTPASAAQVLAGEVGAPAGLPLELPSPGTTDLIIQAIRLQWTKGGGEAQIRLEPRQFGDLTVSVSVNQGQVVARLQADTPIVREWLQANQQLLRQGLADQHLTLSRLEISEPSAESRHGAPRDGQSSRDGRGSSRDERSARRPRTPDTEETFDVVA
jgi:flagellar hook-length control protein FliK